ncbi:MAG TPA: MFS transporter [Streptosporangiaceae bacterium]
MIEPARPLVIKQDPRAPWFAVGVVCFGAFMGQLDASIVTLTFGPMQRQFAAPLAGVQWVSLAYLLALVGLLTPIGRLSDAVGRKLMYTYGFAAFTAASIACGLAPTLGLLVAFRLVQAAGAAMLQANSVALVTTSAPKARMRFALGVQAGAQAVGLALGPTLGGLLTSTVGWRAVYWVNVPVGILAIAAGRYLLPRTREFSRPGRFDWPGTLLLVGWTSGLLLVLSAASGLTMPAWLIIALAALTAAAIAAFGFRQNRAACPLIPVRMLRSAPVVLGLAGSACGYLILFGPLVLIPQLLGHGPGSEARTGLLLSALPLGFGLAALFGDTVLPKAWGNRQRGFAGAVLTCVAMCAAVFIPIDPVTTVVLLSLAGLGLGVFVPANNTVVMRSTEASSASLLGGLVNMSRGIGTTLGISLVALGLHLGTNRYAGAAHVSGRPAFIVLAAVAGVAAVIALAGRHAQKAEQAQKGRQAQAREADPAGAFS